MSCEKGKFSYSFFILLTQWHEFHTPKLTNFHIFIIPPPLNVTLFSKSPYLTVHALEGFLKKHKDVSTTIATAKTVLFWCAGESTSKNLLKSQLDIGILILNIIQLTLTANFCRLTKHK